MTELRLKILHIAGWYPSQRNPVAGVFVREHVKATALYNDVAVLYCEGVDKEIRGLYRLEDNIEDGIRTLRLRYRKSPIPKTSYVIYLWAMFRAFRKLVEEGFRPDIIHAHVYSAGVPAVLIGRRYGLPVVVTEHSSAFPRKLIRGFEKLKAKFAFERADLVCPVSENLRRHIESYGIRARFRVVPNVVDTSVFRPGLLHSSAPGKHILFVGGLDSSHKKGMPYLLEALAQLRGERDDWHLDVVGDGPARNEYAQLASRRGIEDRITFHGQTSKAQVALLMQQGSFVVIPSLFETFSVVAIEALASGLPVLATRCGGPEGFITDDVGMLIPRGDVGALTNALDHMLDHCADYPPERLAKYAEERFGLNAVANEWQGIYRQAL